MQKSSNNRIRDFTDLNAWKKGHELVLTIYQITRDFPREEQFGLSNQMRRAAVSITSNIAEGFCRRSHKEKAYFYLTALGSLNELLNQLLIAKDVKYIPAQQYSDTQERMVVVRKILSGLQLATRRKA